MKTTAKRSRLALLATAFICSPLCVALASDTNTSAPEISTPAPVISAGPAPVISGAPTATAAVKLPYGVEDVLKLSRAQVSDDVILNYVQGSGTIYNLTPKEIVYLKEQGVSEKVINAMLDQRKRAELAAQMPAPAPAAPPTGPIDTTVSPAANAVAPGTAGYADPNATYAEAPLTPPASSVYVIPYSGAGYPYYGPYGYYPSYGWYGPSVAFGFGFGGRGYYGGHYGGHGYYGGHYGGGHAYGGHGGSYGGHGGHR